MSVPEQKARKRYILIAEDDPQVLKLLMETLAGAGFAVLAAENGEIALNVARQHQGSIELLITDVHMPSLDGFDLQERLRQERPEAKLLVISGALPQSIRGRDFPLLRKPFHPMQLTQKVREILGD